MSTRIQQLVAQFDARLTGFRRGVGVALSLTYRLEKDSKSAFEGLGKAASEAAKDVASTFAAVDRVVTNTTVSLGRSLADASIATGKLGFEFLKTKDNALLAFETMLGSGEKAKAFYEQLADFEKRTPFEMPGLLKASQRLLASKVAAEQVIPVMQSVGDAVALVGGDSENIDRAVVAISQMAAKQKISAQEMNQLAENQVFGWEALAQVMGVTVPQAMEAAEKDGAAVFQHFNAFLLQIGANAQGAMDKQSRMLTGLLSTVSSSASRAAGDIFEPMYRDATKFLAWAMGPTGFRMDGIAEKLKETVGKISHDVFTWLQLNGQAALDRLGQAFITFGEAVRNGVAYLRENGNAIAVAVKSLFDWGLAIAKWMAGHPRFMAALLATKLLFATGIPQAITAAVVSLSLLAGQMVLTGMAFQKVFGMSMLQMIAKFSARLIAVASEIGLVQRAATLLQSVGFMSGWVSTLGKVASGITAVKLAILALKAVLVGFFVAVVYKVTEWAAEWAIAEKGVKSFNESLVESVRLMEELFAIRSRLRGTEIQDVLSDPDKERARDTASRRLGQAQQEKERRSNSVKKLEEQEKTFSLWSGVSQAAAIALQKVQAKLEEERRMLDDATQAVQDWQQALGQINREIGKKPPEGKPPTGGGVPATTPDEPGEPPKLTPQQRRDQRIRQHGYKEQERTEEDAVGFPALRGFADAMKFSEGASLDDLEQWLGDLEGVDQGFLTHMMDLLKKKFAEILERTAKAIAEAKAQLEKGEISQEAHDKIVSDVQAQADADRRDATKTTVRGVVRDANSTAEKDRRQKEIEGDAADIARSDDWKSLDGQAQAVIAKEVQAIQDAYATLQISEEEYKRQLDEIRKRVDAVVDADRKRAADEERRAEEANRNAEKRAEEEKRHQEEINQAAAEGSETLQRIMGGLFGKIFPPGSAGAAKLQAEYKRLYDRMTSGQMSVKAFNKEMRSLEERAEKVAEAEKQNRLIRGDFRGAGLDPEQALKDELASRQQSKFQEMISQYADRLTGAGDKAKQFGDNVKNAGDAAQDFASTLPSQQEAASAWEKISNFIASIDGQRALILNNIALMRQSLQITEDALSRQDLQRKIDDLIRQLQVLDQQQANLPTFIADRGDLEFKDPGLAGGGSGGSSRGSVHITLPNVNKFGQAEAELIVNTIEREMTRRGRRL